MTLAQSFLSGGDTFAPSHVYFAGIAPLFAKAGLDSVIVGFVACGSVREHARVRASARQKRRIYNLR